MLTFHDLRRMAKARIDDAKALRAAGRYDGAVYIAGYAVECQLKARIATSLLAQGAWPETNVEFDNLGRLKSHRWEDLLKLSGRKAQIDKSTTRQAAWSYELEAGISIRQNWNGDVDVGGQYDHRGRDAA